MVLLKRVKKKNKLLIIIIVSGCNTKFIRTQNANFIIETTNYVSIIKSLLQMYQGLLRFDEYQYDDIYGLTCHGRFSELKNFGRFLVLVHE